MLPVSVYSCPLFTYIHNLMNVCGACVRTYECMYVYMCIMKLLNIHRFNKVKGRSIRLSRNMRASRLCIESESYCNQMHFFHPLFVVVSCTTRQTQKKGRFFFFRYFTYTCTCIHTYIRILCCLVLTDIFALPK